MFSLHLAGSSLQLNIVLACQHAVEHSVHTVHIIAVGGPTQVVAACQYLLEELSKFTIEAASQTELYSLSANQACYCKLFQRLPRQTCNS